MTESGQRQFNLKLFAGMYMIQNLILWPVSPQQFEIRKFKIRFMKGVAYVFIIRLKKFKLQKLMCN